MATNQNQKYLVYGNVIDFRSKNASIMLHDVIKLTPVTIARKQYIGTCEGMLVAVNGRQVFVHAKPNPLLTIQAFFTKNAVDFIVTDHYGQRFFVGEDLLFECISAIEKITLSSNKLPYLTKDERRALDKRVVDGQVVTSGSSIMRFAEKVRGAVRFLAVDYFGLFEEVDMDEEERMAYIFPEPTVTFQDYLAVCEQEKANRLADKFAKGR